VCHLYRFRTVNCNNNLVNSSRELKANDAANH
jgi:hypothetical protein